MNMTPRTHEELLALVPLVNTKRGISGLCDHALYGGRHLTLSLRSGLMSEERARANLHAWCSNRNPREANCDCPCHWLPSDKRLTGPWGDAELAARGHDMRLRINPCLEIETPELGPDEIDGQPTMRGMQYHEGDVVLYEGRVWDVAAEAWERFDRGAHGDQPKARCVVMQHETGIGVQEHVRVRLEAYPHASYPPYEAYDYLIFDIDQIERP